MFVIYKPVLWLILLLICLKGCEGGRRGRGEEGKGGVERFAELVLDKSVYTVSFKERFPISQHC